MVPFSPEEIACIVENFFAGSKSRARGFSVINWLVGVVVGGWVVGWCFPFAHFECQHKAKINSRAGPKHTQTHAGTHTDSFALSWPLIWFKKCIAAFHIFHSALTMNAPAGKAVEKRWEKRWEKQWGATWLGGLVGGGTRTGTGCSAWPPFWPRRALVHSAVSVFPTNCGSHL